MVLSSKQFHLLGRILCAVDPDAAKTYLQRYEAHRPALQDINLLPGLWRQFRSEADETKHHRRLFVCLVFQLYRPVAFARGFRHWDVRDGLTRATARAMGIKEQRVSQMLGEAIVWYQKNYDSFRDQTDTYLEKLKQAA